MHLTRMTLAVEDVPRMLAFYNATFGTQLTTSGDGPFASGTFAGVTLVLCPNEIAQVDARQSRHQLHLEVDDARAVGRLAMASGGAVDETTARTDGWLVVVVDPEGNTYELVDHQPVDGAMH